MWLPIPGTEAVVALGELDVHAVLGREASLVVLPVVRTSSSAGGSQRRRKEVEEMRGS